MRGTGAEALVAGAIAEGVEVCFANPGTTEMPLVAALDTVPGVRPVLGLFEGVCTGAADGWGRLTGRPALTLLHLGPGLANGAANLHNARRARTPVVTLVGEHASWHIAHDAPLTSDIVGLAATVSGWVGTTTSADSTARDLRDALAASRLGQGATLVVPVDHQQGEVDPGAGPDDARGTPRDRPRAARPERAARVDEVAARVRGAGRVAILLGSSALSRRGQQAAGRIAALSDGANGHGPGNGAGNGTGSGAGPHDVVLFGETFPARAERGGGLPDVDRLPYFPETAAAALRDRDVVVLAGHPEPVAFFGYTGTESLLAPPGSTEVLAAPGRGADQALVDLADALGAPRRPAGVRGGRPPATGPDEALTGPTVGRVLAACLPGDAVVSVEGGTCGYPFFTASSLAGPHTVLTNTGGAIGQGLPVAFGAALAAPERPVVALQSDGSAMYTVQALWSMAREDVDVTVLVASNNTYGVLRTELDRHDVARGGPAAAALTSLADPDLGWVSLARGLGVPACRVTTTGELATELARGRGTGPRLVQMAM